MACSPEHVLKMNVQSWHSGTGQSWSPSQHSGDPGMLAQPLWSTGVWGGSSGAKGSSVQTSRVHAMPSLHGYMLMSAEVLWCQVEVLIVGFRCGCRGSRQPCPAGVV